jgi:hypothetical protein
MIYYTTNYFVFIIITTILNIITTAVPTATIICSLSSAEIKIKWIRFSTFPHVFLYEA